MSIDMQENAIKSRPKGAKPRYKAAQRKAQILDIASSLFSSIGFQTLKMTDIAKACGITKPVLYSHFPSKEALFEASMMQTGQALSQLILKVVADYEEGDEQTGINSLQELVSFVQQHQIFWADQQTAAVADLKVSQMMLHYRDEIATAIAKILAGQRPDTMTEREAMAKTAPLAHALIGAADGGARWWQHNPDVPGEETQRLIRLVLDHFIIMTRDELGTTPKRPPKPTTDTTEAVDDDTPPSQWRSTISRFID